MSRKDYVSFRSMSIEDQPSDIARRRAEFVASQYDTKFINLLPIPVDITLEDMYGQTSVPLGRVAARDSILVSPDKLETGDMLHFTYAGPQGIYHVTPSMFFSRLLGDVRIGDVGAEKLGYNRDFHPNGDISSIQIHNMLPWPINVYLNGKRVAYVKQNRDLGGQNHGDRSLAPYVYFDNGNMGLKLGDKLNLVINNETASEVPAQLYTFVINDREITDVYVGQGTSGIDARVRPEQYRYRLGNDKAFPRGHNARGTDHPVSYKSGSAVECAKYKMLSGQNVYTP